MNIIGNIKIVTDSTADLSLDICEQYGITMVPLKVHFGDEEYLDWLELNPEQFYEKLKDSETLPRTSQPSPVDFVNVYQEIGQEYSTIISVHLSSHLSGTYQSASIAKKMLPKVDIEVIDSKLASMAFGLPVIEGAKAVKEGKNKEEVLAIINRNIDNSKVFFAVETLEYLHRNGRIGKAKALLGGLLNIKPILSLQDGIVVPLGQVRGRKKALNTIMNKIEDNFNTNQPIKLAIVHGSALEEAQMVKEQLESRFKIEDLYITSIGAVIGSHTGPGLVGLIVFPVF